MLRPLKPSPAQLETLLDRALGAELTYPQVGATEGATLPAGYRHDRYEIPLGGGDAVFHRAVSALGDWQAQVRAGVGVFPDGKPVEPNESYLLVIRATGLWALAPCRVVHVIADSDRWGFAYGTLPGHPECGEASFSIERDKDGNSVFRITSFSRSVDPLARLAAPLTRRVQQKVTRRYLEAIAAAARGR